MGGGGGLPYGIVGLNNVGSVCMGLETESPDAKINSVFIYYFYISVRFVLGSLFLSFLFCWWIIN